MLLSGSKFGLARLCQWWCRPEVQAPRVESEAAKRGTNRHKVLEFMARGVCDEAAILPALWGCEPEEWSAIAEEILGWLPRADEGQRSYCEQQYVYDTRDGASHPVDGKDRNYHVEQGQIPLTVDWVGVESGTLSVVDYKTGQQANLDMPASNGQIQLCCLAAARAIGVDTVRGSIVLVDDDGSARRFDHVFDVLDLDAIAEDARSVVDAIPSARPNPGPWCEQKWCPARAVCPATQQAIAGTPVEPLTLAITGPEQCARVHVQLDAAEEFLAAVKAARDAWLQANPDGAPLADGTRLVWGSTQRRSVDLSRARPALDRLGLAGAIETKESVSFEGIKRAIGGDRGRFAELLKELESSNAIKINEYWKAQVRK